MGIAFNVLYHESVIKDDIPRLSTTDKARVRKAIKEKLTYSPEIFGKPLRKSLRGYRKLRIGDYRVIFRIEQNTVKILVIGHRSTVYNKAPKRF